MEPIKINSNPFIFPETAATPLQNGTYAPLVTATRLSNGTDVLVRAIVFTGMEPAEPPQFSSEKSTSGNTLMWGIDFSTEVSNTESYQAWYLQDVLMNLPTDITDINLALSDGRPPKTSRGTVVVIQSNLD